MEAVDDSIWRATGAHLTAQPSLQGEVKCRTMRKPTRNGEAHASKGRGEGMRIPMQKWR